MPFVSIGHSNHELDEFLSLLTNAGVDIVVDVRKLAGSRRYPQFNADALATALAPRGIEYEHIDELTGRRPKSHTVPPETNALWRNQSFHNYADYALSCEFEAGLTRLRALGRASNGSDDGSDGDGSDGDNTNTNTNTNTSTSTSTSDATEPVVAIMCAEAVWWRCHRRIIADYLLAHGETVEHIISAAAPQPATLTPGARVDSTIGKHAGSAAGKHVVYPAPE
ncbi:DUF488 domain-containing protein [Leucobacter sp. HY1908]